MEEPIWGRTDHRGRWRSTLVGTGSRRRQPRIARGATVAATVRGDGGAVEQRQGHVTRRCRGGQGERWLQALGEEDGGETDMGRGHVVPGLWLGGILCWPRTNYQVGTATALSYFRLFRLIRYRGLLPKFPESYWHPIFWVSGFSGFMPSLIYYLRILTLWE
jgi:hypothetical protein